MADPQALGTDMSWGGFQPFQPPDNSNTAFFSTTNAAEPVPEINRMSAMQIRKFC